MAAKGMVKDNVGKDIPISGVPVQPRDPNDEIYAIIKQFTTHGDRKQFAEELNVSIQAVSYVCRGLRHSPTIWEYVMKTVMARKQVRAEFVGFMTSNTQNN